MSLPTPDAQSSNFLPQLQNQQSQQNRQNQQRPQAISPTHSMVAPGVAGSQAARVLHTPHVPHASAMSVAPQPSSFPAAPFPSPAIPSLPPVLSVPSMSSASSTAPMPPAGFSDQIAHERTIDFASHSWDLAAGGLKTLTAKRELPPLPDRMLSGKLQEPVDTDTSRSYTFLLVILACVFLMLVSGGVVLYVMFQP